MKFGTPIRTLACTLPLTLLAGCSYLTALLFPDAPVGSPPAATTAAPPTVVSKDGLAPITAVQVERIREAVGGKPPSPAVGKVVGSASPTIESFLRTEGCITARNGAVLNPFAAPGRLFDGTGFQGGPMAEMQYHDKTACVTVQRIQNWKLVSPRLLRFDVVYVGDDGEERAIKRHELMRQPKGGWLFTR
ncbi:hypothetical protein ACFJIS_04905 [Variovorax boronicumulans]|uniref:hypothetical protein n=1 Tax=Variovorax boronicumulans TaxID=436515 RepID=UPI0036F38680